MSVLVSDEILQAAKMSDADLKRELAEMPLIKFQQELARRQIPVFDDVAGFEVEVDQLKALGDL